MSALYILIPIALIIVALAIWMFFWAVDNGQYDDLDSPAHSILFDDDDPLHTAAAQEASDSTPAQPQPQTSTPPQPQSQLPENTAKQPTKPQVPHA